MLVPMPIATTIPAEPAVIMAHTAHIMQPSTTKRAKRIAVIGSGIAGLSSAYFLSTTNNRDVIGAGAAQDAARFDVTLFERTATIGIDAHSFSFPSATLAAHSSSVAIRNTSTPTESKTVRIDVPLRVFTSTYYPQLTALYNHLDVETIPEDYSGSFTSFDTNEFLFTYSNIVLSQNLSIPYLTAPISNIFSSPFPNLISTILTKLGQSISPLSYAFNRKYFVLVRDLVYFLTFARKHLSSGKLGHPSNPSSLITLQEYVDEENYSSEFLENMLLPTLAGICTCSERSILAYPAYIVVDYLSRRHLRGVRRVRSGTSDAAARFIRHCKVKLNTSVIRVVERPVPSSNEETKSDTPLFKDSSSSSVLVHSENNLTGEVSVDEFDEVIIATQANHAAAFFSNSSNVVPLLRQIPYERSELVLHTDKALMPGNTQVWRSVNFILRKSAIQSNSNPKITLADCMASIWMNQAQTGLNEQLISAGLVTSSSAPIDIIQTWNPLISPSPEKLLTAVHFERPVVTKDSLSIIQRLWNMQGKSGVWFVGSYLSEGMPLLEAGVTTSLRVCEMLNVVPTFLTRFKYSSGNTSRNGSRSRRRKHQTQALSSKSFGLHLLLTSSIIASVLIIARRNALL